MIVGPDFIWLHFPKCAGTTIEATLRSIAAYRADIKFDPINPKNVIWHEALPQRSARDPSFEVDGKAIISCIRRLPHWLLSRVYYEANRQPHWITTREMLIEGKFFENNGYVNHADWYVSTYNNPTVNFWIRTEHLSDDFCVVFNRFFDLPNRIRQLEKRKNKTQISYIQNLKFHFTRNELTHLYKANPVWADIEKRIYGNLLCDSE